MSPNSISRPNLHSGRTAQLLPLHRGAICLTAPSRSCLVALYQNVVAGGPSSDHTRWIGSGPRFFLPVKVLSRVFRRPQTALACSERRASRTDAGCIGTRVPPGRELQSNFGCCGVTGAKSTTLDQIMITSKPGTILGRLDGLCLQTGALKRPVPYAKLEDPQTLNLYSYVKDNIGAK